MVIYSILETIQDTHVATVEHCQEITYDLSNIVIAGEISSHFIVVM